MDYITHVKRKTVMEGEKKDTLYERLLLTKALKLQYY